MQPEEMKAVCGKKERKQSWQRKETEKRDGKRKK